MSVPRVRRLLLVLLVGVSMSACPARRPGAAEDPGPPAVLDPNMLDRA
jgi:hypothetical protein